jgi:predicted permease
MLRRLLELWKRETREADLEREIRSHLEAETEEQIEAGLSPLEAGDAARRSFGSGALARELTREAWGGMWLERLAQDLRYAFRTIRHSPGFTSAAVLSLGLGIGANTAVFSVLDAVLLRSLPVRDPKQLWIFAHRGGGEPSTGCNYHHYETLREGGRSFADLMAFWPLELKVRVGPEYEALTGQYVTTNYFSALGVQPLFGRAFTDGDSEQPVALVSHGWWRRRLGGSPDVIGKGIVIAGVPLTIVGVTPPEFFGMQVGNAVDVSLPFGLQPRVSPEFGDRRAEREGTWGLRIVGRLKPAVEPETARAEVAGLLGPWIAELARRNDNRLGSWARVELLPGGMGFDGLRRSFSRPLQVLMAIAGLVLLISCANVANLLLARAASRSRELAVRLAIGASRRRLIRQLLTESALLAALGGMLGLLLAVAGVRGIVALLSSGASPVVLSAAPDARILAFTAASCLLTALLFGTTPAFRSARLDPLPALKQHPHESRLPAGMGGRKLLVAFQVSLSLLLLVGAGLFVRSLENIRALETGFAAERLLLVTFSPLGTGGSGQQLWERLGVFYAEVLERVRALPLVEAASLSNLGPLSGDNQTRRFSTKDFSPRDPADQVVVVNTVSAGFFETMGIPLLRGRSFAETRDARDVAILSETAARFYFGGRDPVGQGFRIGPDDAPLIEIVGVARDAKQRDVREPAPRLVYLPWPRNLQPFMTLEIRAASHPSSLIPGIREAVRSASRDFPIASIRTVRMQLDSSLVQERLVAVLSALFGALALALASIGLYGVVSYTIARRTGEIGIRMALGASRRAVLRMVLWEAGFVVAAGAAIGLLGSAGTARAVSSMLYGLQPTDPGVFLTATLTLLAVALPAALLPARRASRIDPLTALRCE